MKNYYGEKKHFKESYFAITKITFECLVFKQIAGFKYFENYYHHLVPLVKCDCSYQKTNWAIDIAFRMIVMSAYQFETRCNLCP